MKTPNKHKCRRKGILHRVMPISIDDLIFRLEAMADDERYCPDEWSRAILMQSAKELKGLRQE